MIKKIKEGIATVLAFTTGLGFYGLGLLIVGALMIGFGWTVTGSGFLGAFIYKNYKAIVEHVRKL